MDWRPCQHRQISLMALPSSFNGLEIFDDSLAYSASGCGLVSKNFKKFAQYQIILQAPNQTCQFVLLSFTKA